MQHTLNCPPLIVPSELGANPAFTVVIAYQDFETGKHAKRTYDFLVENLGNDCSFVNQMWKFEVLSIAKLREIAAEDAAKADIVIISCRGDELPEHVKAWIASWSKPPCNPMALVALFDPSRERASQAAAVRSYLAEIARRGGMEFFAQQQPKPRLKRFEVPSSRVCDTAKLSARTLSTLAGMVEEDEAVPRWGVQD